ncbi:MAG: glutamate cyclase domain-containing protein [Phycisphaerae bacterium]
MGPAVALAARIGVAEQRPAIQAVNPRIASIENLIAADPGDRNVFAFVLADQLRLAAQSLRLAKRVGIVSGFFVGTVDGGAGETDGPPGAKAVGTALRRLGIAVDYITDRWNAGLFRALGLEPIVDVTRYLTDARPTHLLAIERVGRGPDGRYRNMRGVDVTDATAPLDELFIEAGRLGLTTVGIGDGGNEVGMGKVFVDALDTADRAVDLDGRRKWATIIPTDFCIAAGVSNWGAYGLAGALSVLEERDLLPSAEEAARDVELLVRDAGAVDGVTHRREATVDGVELCYSIRILESIRRLVVPSPLENTSTTRPRRKGEARGRAISLRVGVLGYGETGRAAVALLTRRGHRACLSEQASVTVDQGTVLAGLETGGHTIDFLRGCDLVVASPGVRADAEIRDALDLCGIPVVSELEFAYQLCDRELIAVTGTIGKRTTIELLQRLFEMTGRKLMIGGNRGRPLSALVLDLDCASPSLVSDSDAAGTSPPPLAIAVSSFQLESVVHFRPHVAVMLNIDEAHLDRHRTVAEYVRTKSRIFMNQRPDDILILTFDDLRLRPLARKHHGRTLFVSGCQEVDRGAWLLDGVVYMNVDGQAVELGRARTPFPENLLSSLLTARVCGIPLESIATALPKLSEWGQSP